MPRQIISVAVQRRSSKSDAAFGENTALVAVGTFQARDIWASGLSVQRIEDGPGVVTKDDKEILAFLDPATPVQVSDICALPDGRKVRILGIRRMKRRCQCEVSAPI